VAPGGCLALVNPSALGSDNEWYIEEGDTLEIASASGEEGACDILIAGARA
jgi:hypothetical protein